jgi:uncharacterized protein (DUF58 family)
MLKSRPEVFSFEKRRTTTLMLVLDVSLSMLFSTAQGRDKFDILLLFLALANDFAMQGNLVGTLIFDHQVRKLQPAHSAAATQDLAEELASYSYPSADFAKPTNLRPALGELLFGLPERSLVLIISDFIFEANYAEEMRQLSDSHDVVPIVLTDAEDNLSAPRGSCFLLKDIETGRLGYYEKVSSALHQHFEIFRLANTEPIMLSVSDSNDAIFIKLNKYFARRRC